MASSPSTKRIEIMKVCLFYKKLPQKFWVIEVSKNEYGLDVQIDDCKNRNPHSCVDFKPLEMTESMANRVRKHLEEKYSVHSVSLVREEDYLFHI